MTVSIFKWPAIYRTVGDEIIGPQVVRVLWPQPDEGAVVEPQPSTFRLSGRTLSPSRRQMRTRVALTRQPSVGSNAVMRRLP